MSPLRVAAFLVFFSVPWVGSCLDTTPQAYPHVFQTRHNFSGHITQVTPLPLEHYGSDVVLEFHFGSSDPSKYLEIRNVRSQAILKRINIKTSLVDDSCRYTCDYPLGFRPDGQVEAYFCKLSELKAEFFVVNLTTNKVTPVAAIQAPAGISRSGGWDSGFNIDPYPDSSDPSSPAAVLYENYGHYLGPRNIRIMDSLDPPVVRRVIPSGPPFRLCLIMDCNADGQRDLLFGTTSPGNGNSSGGLPDSTLYVAAYDYSGDLIWRTMLQSAGGNSYLFEFRDRPGRLFATAVYHYSSGQNTPFSRLMELDPATGSILSSARYPGRVGGYPSHSMSDPLDQLLWYQSESGELQTLTVSGDILAQFPEPVRLEGFLVVAGSQSLYQLVGDDLRSIIVDASLQPVAVFEDSSVVMSAVAQDQFATYPQGYLVVWPGSDWRFAELVQQPAVVWFLWRFRVLVIILVILVVAVIPTVVFAVKHARERYRRRRQAQRAQMLEAEKLQQTQRAQEEANRARIATDQVAVEREQRARAEQKAHLEQTQREIEAYNRVILQQILDHALAGYLLLSQDGRVLLINPRIQSLLTSTSKVVSHIQDLDEGFRDLTESVRHRLETNASPVIGAETPVRLRNGSILWARLYATRVSRPDDHWWIMITLDDINIQPARTENDPQLSQLGPLVGSSPAMLTLFDRIRKYAALDDPVLILGESGTGKTAIANLMHKLSGRPGKHIERINCGEVPHDLAPSLLKGYLPGVFTGGLSKGRKGHFEVAGGGTLFLDEIGDAPDMLQSTLLDVLQEKSYTVIGESKARPFRARIIAATNKDLLELKQAGKFRHDLLNRLSLFTLRVPPLREMKDDIIPLAEHFIRKHQKSRNKNITGIDLAAQSKLRNRDWRGEEEGNIRGLEHCMIRALEECDETIIRPQHLVLDPIRDEIVPPEPGNFPTGHNGSYPAAAPESNDSGGNGRRIRLTPTQWVSRKSEVIQVLAQNSGSVSDTAAVFHVSERQMRNVLKKYLKLSQEEIESYR